MQNPWGAKMLNVYLVSVECITDKELCKVMLIQRCACGATSKLLIGAKSHLLVAVVCLLFLL